MKKKTLPVLLLALVLCTTACFAGGCVKEKVKDSFQTEKSFYLDLNLSGSDVGLLFTNETKFVFKSDNTCVSYLRVTPIAAIAGVVNSDINRKYRLETAGDKETLVMINEDVEPHVEDKFDMTKNSDGKYIISGTMLENKIVYVETSAPITLLPPPPAEGTHFTTVKTFNLDRSNPMVAAGFSEGTKIVFQTDGNCVSTIVNPSLPVPINANRTYRLEKATAGDTLIMINNDENPPVEDVYTMITTAGKIVLTVSMTISGIPVPVELKYIEV